MVTVYQIALQHPGNRPVYLTMTEARARQALGHLAERVLDKGETANTGAGTLLWVHSSEVRA